MTPKDQVIIDFMKYAGDIPEEMLVQLKLHNVSDRVLNYKKVEMPKTAEEDVYLLPRQKLCKVSSLEDLHKAAALFEKEHDKLRLPERVEFSQNYVKVASEYADAEYPFTIIKYAGTPDTDMHNLKYALEMRTAAANNMGRSGEEYQKIAELLETGKVTQVKLAEIIYDLDKQHGFDRRRNMSDPYDMVFNKMAEEAPQAAKLSKPEIVAKYGEGILAEIEQPDGAVNYDRFNQIVRTLPDVKSI